MGLRGNVLLETGIALDPVMGFPVIPSSGLKGITRCYAERVAEEPPERVDEQFGWQADEQGGCGDLVFLTGVSVAPPQIERDVVCPIYGDDYRGAETPASYLSPQPFFFLALGRSSRYQFGVASLSGNRQSAAQDSTWLQAALQTIGVGAKSAAGYGFWVIDPEAQ